MNYSVLHTGCEALHQARHIRGARRLDEGTAKGATSSRKSNGTLLTVRVPHPFAPISGFSRYVPAPLPSLTVLSRARTRVRARRTDLREVSSPSQTAETRKSLTRAVSHSRDTGEASQSTIPHRPRWMVFPTFRRTLLARY